MMLELPDQVFEELADKMGVWGAHDDERCREGKLCRCCWMLHYVSRLKEALATEAYLQKRYQEKE